LRGKLVKQKLEYRNKSYILDEVYGNAYSGMNDNAYCCRFY